MPMREIALVTGSHGFIGRHLTKLLESRKIEVVKVDHYPICATSYLESRIRVINPTYIFHLAAYGNHGMQKEIDDCIWSNYMGTYSLLQASLSINYKAFINISTSSCYGKRDTSMSEDDPLNPDTFYAATKAGAQYLARAFAMQFNKPIVTAIPFSVYGPGEADWRFIPTAIRNMLEGTTMSFVPFPTHDWIYVDDFIDALMLLSSVARTYKGQAFNIGTGVSSSNQEIITFLSNIADKGIKTENSYSEPPHHSPVWRADISKISKLGWNPQVLLADGLAKTYNHYKQLYESK